MKRHAILLLLCLVVNNLNADVLSKLSEATEEKPITCYDTWRIFSIYMDGNDLTASIFSDTSDHASIMAYKVADNSVKIIIKLRTKETMKISGGAR